MSTHPAARRFPAIPLLGAGGLAALTMAAALVGHLSGAHVTTDATAALAARNIVVADRADGAVLVKDAGDGSPIETVVGQAGFLRGIFRALARERRIDGVGREHAFRLTAWADGRLTLDDTVTGRRIELEAFGPTNAAVFARFLPAAAASSAGLAQQGSHS